MSPSAVLQTDGWPAPQSRSAAWRAMLTRLIRFARDDTAPILLEGESGTGKTRLARLVHEHSPRVSEPFRHVVLSAIDDGVAASELFGHVQGAFTDARQARIGQFASAKGGTLFLDEIGKASGTVQARLLHALEYGEFRPVGADREVRVSVRIVAATNVDLARLVARERFLPDLHARLATFRIVVPPLRKRRADIPGLVAESIARHSRAAGYVTDPRLDPHLMNALQRAPWPNNVRELDATVHRLLLEADGDLIISFSHCVGELEYLIKLHSDPKSVRAEQIEHAIEACSGNLSAAARSLGVDRKTLRMRLRKQLGRPSPGGRDNHGTPQSRDTDDGT